jgi:hypothetical protein
MSRDFELIYEVIADCQSVILISSVWAHREEWMSGERCTK